VVQCGAVWCDVVRVQCGAVCCNCVAVSSQKSLYFAVCCKVLQRVAVFCSVVQCVAIVLQCLHKGTL